MTHPINDRELGERAVRERIVTPEELEGCLTSQRLRPRALADVLHELQYVTLLQLDRLQTPQPAAPEKPATPPPAPAGVLRRPGSTPASAAPLPIKIEPVAADSMPASEEKVIPGLRLPEAKPSAGGGALEMPSWLSSAPPSANLPAAPAPPHEPAPQRPAPPPPPKPAPVAEPEIIELTPEPPPPRLAPAPPMPLGVMHSRSDDIPDAVEQEVRFTQVDKDVDVKPERPATPMPSQRAIPRPRHSSRRISAPVDAAAPETSKTPLLIGLIAGVVVVLGLIIVLAKGC